MSTNNLQAIQFYGGPIDGHVDRVRVPMKPFVAIKTMTQTDRAESVTVFIRTLFFHDERQSEVLAVYELQTHESHFGYYYMLSTAATDAELDNSCHVMESK